MILQLSLYCTSPALWIKFEKHKSEAWEKFKAHREQLINEMKFKVIKTAERMLKKRKKQKNHI